MNTLLTKDRTHKKVHDIRKADSGYNNGERRSSEFHPKIYRDTICISKNTVDGRRAIAKTFADEKPCTRHNQITRFTHERVKLQLAFVFPFFPLFPFRLFYTVDMSSVRNFFLLKGAAFRQRFRTSLKFHACKIYPLYETLKSKVFHESSED